MMPKPQIIQLLTHGLVFVYPSVYEPLGIVNLEAMACEVPVVASATGVPPAASTAMMLPGPARLLSGMSVVVNATYVPLAAMPPTFA